MLRGAIGAHRRLYRPCRHTEKERECRGRGRRKKREKKRLKVKLNVKLFISESTCNKIIKWRANDFYLTGVIRISSGSLAQYFFCFYLFSYIFCYNCCDVMYCDKERKLFYIEFPRIWEILNGCIHALKKNAAYWWYNTAFMRITKRPLAHICPHFLLVRKVRGNSNCIVVL